MPKKDDPDFRALPPRSLPESISKIMLDAIDEGLVAANSSGCVTVLNRVAREELGIHQHSSLDEIFRELWPHVLQAFRGRRPREEIPVRIGESVYRTTVIPAPHNGSVPEVVCVFRKKTRLDEISGEVHAYQDLTRELETIINSSSDGLWICDAQANVIRINNASERINKITAAEVIGRNMGDLVEQGFIDRSVTLEVLRTGRVANILQQREGRKLILTGTPVFDGEGSLIRVVVSERDITEIDTLQRNLEEQEAIKDQFRQQVMEMQEAVLDSRRIIAKSPCMIKALRQAFKVGRVNSSVLLLGESGVGKGLIADLIHKNSDRTEKPMIKINCGAIPESLIESELFGYEKGAFTGANGSKPGYLEMADRGILFLDEIAELPLSSQVKLLRFLEDGRVMRLGGTRGRHVDVRILAATHRDLEKMVEESRFRLDLYYRLNVIPIHIPAVRERKECILPMIRYYIDFFGDQTGIKKRLTRAASDALLAYPYPGNVRELMNICERLVVMTETELIDVQDLPQDIAGGAAGRDFPSGNWPEGMSLQQILDTLEKSVLEKAIERYGSQAKAASVLGVNQSTINRKLKKHGIVQGSIPL